MKQRKDEEEKREKFTIMQTEREEDRKIYTQIIERGVREAEKERN